MCARITAGIESIKVVDVTLLDSPEAISAIGRHIWGLLDISDPNPILLPTEVHIEQYKVVTNRKRYERDTLRERTHMDMLQSQVACVPRVQSRQEL